MSQCKHTARRELKTRCFSGSVAVAPYTEENRAAHGNITVRVECVECGARRSENINGCHIEVSTWRDSRAEREATVRRGRIALDEAPLPAPMMLTSADGRAATVSVDTDGMLIVDASGSPADHERIVCALPRKFLDAAKARRRAALALADARAEVQS